MKNDLKLRSKSFAHQCVKLALSIPKTKLGNHIEGQLIRSATSVAANYRAACIGQSKKSFIAKLSIAIEEVDESNFWIQFLIDEHLIDKNVGEPLLKESSELTSIFIASRITAEKNMNR